MSETSMPTVVHHQPDQQIAMDAAMYQRLYADSLQDPTIFWDEQARRVVTWSQTWDEVCVGNFSSQTIQWFVNGKLNACYNCLDRHLPSRSEQLALIWEGSEPNDSQTYTYQALHQEVCRFANVLLAQGLQKGDRVGIYLPMIPQLVIAMLACARIGVVHSVVFSGFSADALMTRLQDTGAKCLITADEGLRGEKYMLIKHNADLALQACPLVRTVVVVRRTGRTVPWSAGRDIWYHDVMQQADANCPVVTMDASDPLFILYTSGSTGKPKGIVHSTGGYLVYATLTHQVVFDQREGDVLFCTADPGWITGHTYLVYGPLSNGTTTILFEGIPNYPSYARYWQIIDKYQVSIFYTSPTALRALRAAGDHWLVSTKRTSLRLLGSVGEPIASQVWLWYYQVVGEERCPIVNTWWQTESGGILISALPSDNQFVPGSAGPSFLGILPEIVDEQGEVIQDGRHGHLVIRHPWPGLMQTIFGDHQRMIDSYFKPVPGCYSTGDEAYRDANGNVMIIGRNDDVIKVSGHRLGSEELETAMMSYLGVAEVAVIGVPHEIKGECIVAFVTLMPGVKADDALRDALQQHVRDKIGAIASSEKIYWAPGLPKTRSGKIMRRILRKIACRDVHELGDLSTLADMGVVQQLVADR